MDDSLTALLESSSNLLESKKEEYVNAGGNLQTLLEERLHNYYSNLGIGSRTRFETLQDAQLATATEALSVLERIESILIEEDPSDAKQRPLLGTRDLATLRTLTGLIFKWGTEPLLKRVNDTWKVDLKGKGRRIVEVEVEDQGYATLSSIMTRIMAILVPNGIQGNMSPTFISTNLTNKHLVDILRTSILLGWLPASLSTTSAPTIDHLRPRIMRLLSILHPAMLITALGTILSEGSSSPVYVRKAASSFLTQQLIRPGGVMGLCESVFGEEETTGEPVKLDKLEQLSRTLVSVPSKFTPKEYFEIIIPRISQLLSETVPASYRKIGAFTLSQMLGSGKHFKYQDVAAPIIYSILHQPFLRVSTVADDSTYQLLLPSKALSNLVILISNCDPSPELISTLLSPILHSLYSLLFHLSSQKTADPQLKEAVQGLLITWGKITDASEAQDLLWSLIQDGQRQYWEAELGRIRLVPEPESIKPLDLLTLEDLKKEEEQDSFDANLFDLYPDPTHFVCFLKLLDRGDIVSELFIKTLDAYHQSQSSDGNPIKSLHYLQLFMQMQLQLVGGSPASILKKPDQLLAFIKQVLQGTSKDKEDAPNASQYQVLDTGQDSDDSDDEDPSSEVVGPNDEMVETTINLLLSVLENHESLSARTAPIMNDIFSLLEPISFSDSTTLGPLAREARMVITARSATTSTSRIGTGTGRGSDEEDAQEVYQKALKLLQDPILPVRAHGLLLLRQLVTPKPKSAGAGATVTDPALVPAILSIFLQSIQDEDSYIFLNGVQGLAAMVDGFGKEVLKGLVREYSSGLEGATSMSQKDLDVRIRIGEALSTVIQRCGTSLGKYGDTLIPSLFSVFRSTNAPAILRSSSVSLLADCISTYPLVTLQYTEDLAQGVVDMLQVESRPLPTRKAKKPRLERNENGGAQEDATPEPIGDNDHLSVNPSYPPFRRAGIHLLGLLIRATVRLLDEGQLISPFSGAFVKRAHITLSYAAATDVDAIVRVMAREVNEELTSLEPHLLQIVGSSRSLSGVRTSIPLTTYGMNAPSPYQ